MYNRQYNVSGLSDDSGAVVEYYAYTPYGKQTIMDAAGNVLTESAYNNHYGFTGRYKDVETGLWYFRARYYSDELGRFTSRDPLGFVDGMSLYAGYFAVGFGLDPSGYSKTGGKGGGGRITGDDPKPSTKQEKAEGSRNKQKQRGGKNKKKPKQKNCPTGGTESQSEQGDPNAVEVANENGGWYPQPPEGWLDEGGYTGEETGNQLVSDLPSAQPSSPQTIYPDGNVDGSPVSPSVPNGSSTGSSVISSETAVGVGVAVGAGYLIYRGARMVPSLFPPLWPTIPANVAIP